MRKKKVYRLAAHQRPRKRVKQNEGGPDESTDEDENILDCSSDDDLESSGENEAESVKELWKDTGKFNSISYNCSVVNHKHNIVRIVSAR